MAAAGSARAADATAVDERALQLDQSIQALKDEVVEFTREAQGVENDVLYPPQSRVDVYVGVKVSGLLLKEVTVAIDQNRPETYSYEDRDARALLSDFNLQRVLRANVNPGAHRLRVTFSGQFYDAKPDEAPITDSYEAIFDKTATPAELELVISRPTRFAKPRLSMKQWRAAK